MSCEDILQNLPPVLPTFHELIENYLLDLESLPIHDPSSSRKWWPRVPNPRRLLVPHMMPATTSVGVERDPATGEITGVKEIMNTGCGSTSKNSFSLKRALGPPEETVRGSKTNYPFWPGGIPEPKLGEDVMLESLIDTKNLLTHHPQLSRGINFSKEAFNEKSQEDVKTQDVSIAEMLKVDDSVLKIFDVKEDKSVAISAVALEGLSEEEISLVNDFTADSGEKETKVVRPKIPVIKIENTVTRDKIVQTEFAEMVDVNAPVDDFSAKVPALACEYPFELDIFQKQAIIHLEKHDSVFVAAHTSAGKTAVAEYAIALSLKHLTRSIYTSPIKALSNQKYRELKAKFGDVGLLTGDIQINPKASCLIMTTEILQSMLYNGSDLVRDLEWVIFDEVHYINNEERGHVWEEVIIMLPSHVKFVLLSATVPNTLEFADWIGRIKKCKIYVISTTKRPVPLEHYLYTGAGGKNQENFFIILDSKGKFLMEGYTDAVAFKKDKKKNAYGPKAGYKFNLSEGAEKTLWVDLISNLKKRDLLPVVAFVLSKNRCDQYASMLTSQDLTSQKEKRESFSFIKKCIDRLQGSDKELPQVLHMTELLTRGIGVHHSGILPILKEVVEMLFAKGLVKLLFATETFAMGVNMPARCVVFDSIRKHDGLQVRNLVPSEYIQMAGRAGRRGLDSTGTVIVICKVDIPEVSELQQMMLGKPSKLESQFKLTYSMILNLLRVEALRVEDMLKRSFSESVQLKNQTKYETELEEKERRLKDIVELNCMICQGIDKFYAAAKEYVELRKKVHKMAFSHPNAGKLLQLGRVILISYEQYQNYLACLVKLDPRNRDRLTVFILTGQQKHVSNIGSTVMKMCLAASSSSFTVLEAVSGHMLLEISYENIIEITTVFLKIDGNKIVENVKKREIPRFKDDPPNSACNELIMELSRINEYGGKHLLESYISLKNDLGIKELNAVESVCQLEKLRNEVRKQPCLECPQFSEHFAISFEHLQLREDIGRLKYLISEESLQLHPEYQIRIAVLKQLGYIENNNTVTLKGRVACEIGNHNELMVTELLLENVFADKPVEDIAALLSSLVFQQRHSDSADSETLKAGIEEFRSIAMKIGNAQRVCGLKETAQDFVDQFNFGLAEVVRQWALGMPFNKIMEQTDVQEGITVKTIQRLDETLRGVRNAARIIGDPNLYEKMEKASLAIKRDIVFAASLYTQ